MKPLQFYRLVVEMRKHQTHLLCIDGSKEDRKNRCRDRKVEQIVMKREKQRELFRQDE